MKKSLIALLFGILLLNPISQAFAQEYEDLLVLLVDEKYEKCLDKAEKYTDKDETKNDPLPYLYAAQALFAMSQDHQYIEDYPKAYKECLTWIGKYRKKDKAYTYRTDAEPFIEELKGIILEEVDNYLLEASEKSYKKALSLMKKVTKMDPDCGGSMLLRGELEVLNKNKSEGKDMVVEGFDMINKVGTDIQFDDLTLTQQKYMKYSLMFSAKLVKEKDLARAREIIAIGQPYFGEERDDCKIEDNSDFNKLYKEITG
ncbi:hypothetical protein [Parvicella tangerina]|uniref:Tetratricopeptide repeat protein n=1 Tax=Parvicella tangerina TaxID=2829795 RepID=A0A916JP54_9FLAO|nr:hypothetical protein [Parvicella tangerina]CAG5083496.1 hypothetical protein CRYO30217_02214 [Parvicella tangerina]